MFVCADTDASAGASTECRPTSTVTVTLLAALSCGYTNLQLNLRLNKASRAFDALHAANDCVPRMKALSFHASHSVWILWICSNAKQRIGMDLGCLSIGKVNANGEVDNAAKSLRGVHLSHEDPVESCSDTDSREQGMRPLRNKKRRTFSRHFKSLRCHFAD